MSHDTITIIINYLTLNCITKHLVVGNWIMLNIIVGFTAFFVLVITYCMLAVDDIITF